MRFSLTLGLTFPPEPMRPPCKKAEGFEIAPDPLSHCADGLGLIEQLVESSRRGLKAWVRDVWDAQYVIILLASEPISVGD
jgi:hypothetical protein